MSGLLRRLSPVFGGHRFDSGFRVFGGRSVLAAVLLLVISTAGASAQTLVSNTGQEATDSSVSIVGGTSDVKAAQAFATGSDSGGYSVYSVGIHVNAIPDAGGTFKLEIFTTDGNGAPGTAVRTLTNPSTFVAGKTNYFAASPHVHLNPNSIYSIVATHSGGGQASLYNTSSNDEDHDRAGWSIADNRHYSSSSGEWTVRDDALKIAINGSSGNIVDGTAPAIQSAQVSDNKLRLVYDEVLDSGSVPPAAAFSVLVAGVPKRLAATDPVTVSGYTVTLTLATVVTLSQTVTVSYTVPVGTGVKPIQDLAGTDAVGLSGETVTNPVANVCDRTVQVRNAILEEIDGVAACANVTATHLANIDGELFVSSEGVNAFQAIDFQGLTGLNFLHIGDNQLTSLPAGVFDDLTELETLVIQNNRLTSLPANVFDRLTRLEYLYIGYNKLTSLPVGVFDNLTELRELILVQNRLTSLPPGVFDSLTRLTNLWINANQLTSLPTDLFDGLTQLERLELGFNQLTTLPDLSTTESLLTLGVHHNPLSNLGTLMLADGSDNPITVTPSFDGGTVSYTATTAAASVRVTPMVADTGSFHARTVLRNLDLADPTIAVGLQGGTFTEVTSGSASGAVSLTTGENTIEVKVTGRAIEAGGRDSGPRTYTIIVTRTSADTNPPTLSSATVQGDTLTLTYNEALDTNSVPAASDFSVTVAGTPVSLVATDPVAVDGFTVTLTLAVAVTIDQSTVAVSYTIPDGTGANPIQDLAGTDAVGFAGETVTNTMTNVCDRTPQIRDAILEEIDGVTDCADVTVAHLAAIDGELRLYGRGIAALKAIDFRDLTELKTLSLIDSKLNTIPPDVFDDLTELRSLTIRSSAFASLPSGVFDGLTALERMEISYTRLTSLPSDVFDGLTRLVTLSFHNNSHLTSLPTGIFDGLSGLRYLYIFLNRELTSLPTGVFDDLTGLRDLSLSGNQLTSLPTGVFDDLTGLRDLSLSRNQLTSLPTGVFDDLTGLRELSLNNNQLTSLPDLSAATQLSSVHVDENPLSNLSTLVLTDGSNNPITVTPSFDGSTDSYTVTTLAASVRVNPTVADTGRFLAELVRSEPDLADPTVEVGLRGGSFTAVTNGLASDAINLVTGENVLEVRVTGRATEAGGRDTGPNSYTIVLTRTSSDGTPPTLSSAWVHGDTLTLTYDKSLDTNSVPAASDFSVSVGGTAVSLATVDPVAVSGFTVTLTLASAVTSDQTVTLSYSVPAGTGAHPIQDLAGTDAVALSGETVSSSQTNVCDRTAQIRDVIVDKIDGVTHCAEVTAAHLAAIDGSLNVSDKGIAALQTIDFQGLAGLEMLDVSDNQLTSLPTDIFSGLTGLEDLDIRVNQLTTLPADIFDGLTELRTLNLDHNRLATLPNLAGSTGLQILNVNYNRLTSLPDPTGLTGLRHLNASDNLLTSLPDLVRLTDLIILDVSSNRLTSLPDLSTVAYLFRAYVSGNPLSNLSTLSLVDGSDNPIAVTPSFDGDTVSYTATTTAASVRVTPTVADTGRFHADTVRSDSDLTAPVIEAGLLGGTFTAVASGSASDAINLVNGENTLEVRVTGRATEAGGRSTGPKTYTITVRRTGPDLTPPTLSSATVRGDRLTLTYDEELDTNSVPTASDFSVSVAGTPVNLAATDPVAVSSSTITLTLATAVTPGQTVTVSYTVPAGEGANPIQNLAGLDAVGLSDETVTNPATNVCDRTAQVRDAILEEIDGVTDCADVTAAHLAAIDGSLSFLSSGITELKAIDFQGLTGLTELYFSRIPVNSLPTDLFGDLTGLERLEITSSQLTSLPSDIFDGLTALESLHIGYNQLTSLPAGVFDDLTELNELIITHNRLTTLPAGVLDNLTRLEFLHIGYNQLTSLPAGVFDNLTEMRDLVLPQNRLTSLPTDVFDNLTVARNIWINQNRFTSLPTDLFDGLTALERVELGSNQLTSLPDLSAAESLSALGVRYNPLSNLSALELADGSDNPITVTPSFDGGTVSYTATTAAASVRVTPTVADTGRFHANTIRSNPDLADPTIGVGLQGGTFTEVTSGSASGAVSLTTGDNIIEVRVTGRATEAGGRDRGPRTYTIILTRTSSDGTSPTLSSATVHDNVLTLIYDKSLDTNSIPAASDFSVSVDRTPVSLSATDPVAVNGFTVTLTLATAVTSGQTVTLDYTVPTGAGANPIQDLVGIDAAALSGETVTSSATSVCDRTPQIRDAILDEIDGVTNCADVTVAHLAAIDGRLSVSNEGITSLQAFDFQGLTGLEDLYIGNNRLASLPAGLFDGLAALADLDISGNQLTSLPAGLFDDLVGLENLFISNNRLASLPTGLFDRLTELEDLYVDNNRLTSLPDLSGAAHLFDVNVDGNPLSSLSSLTLSDGSDNPITVTPSFNAGTVRYTATTSATSVRVTPTAADTGGFHEDSVNFDSDLAAPVIEAGLRGGTFMEMASGLASGAVNLATGENVLEVKVTGRATEAGGRDTGPRIYTITVTRSGTDITPPMLHSATVHGDMLTLTYDEELDTSSVPAASDYSVSAAGTSLDLAATDPVVVSGSTVTLTLATEVTPGQSITVSYTVPAGMYANPIRDIVGNNAARLSGETVINAVTNVCQRTAKIRDAILDKIDGVTDCADVTAAHLAAIDRWLNVSHQGITALQTIDFQGLTGLEVLEIKHNQLTSLPEGVFDDLAGLEVLSLGHNQLTSLPEGVFDDLTGLERLFLGRNQLTSLSADVFDDLTGLERLYLGHNQLTSLPTDVFDGLTKLERLSVNDNQLTSLPAGVFDDLTKLELLHIGGNRLISLLAGMFDDLTKLRRLYIGRNQLISLPMGVFDDLTRLEALSIRRNRLTSLPAGVFDDLLRLEVLSMGRNRLTSLPAGVFDGLTGLRKLYINNNQLTSLPDLSTTSFFNMSVHRNPLSNLSALSMTDGSDNAIEITPFFDGGTVSYTATTAAASVRVTPTAADTGRFPADFIRSAPNLADPTIETGLQGDTFTAVTSGSASGTVSLATGENVLKVRVTGRATNSGGRNSGPKTYKITVTRTSSDVIPPSLSSATVLGDTLTLTYDKTLDTSSVPATSDFSVLVDRAPMSLAATDPVAVSGFTVTLTLATAVTSGQTVSLSYTAPTGAGANPIQDIAGTDATDLSGERVANAVSNFCDRTPQVRYALLDVIDGVTDCADVTTAHLAAIGGKLSISKEPITALQEIDFQGLTGLASVHIIYNHQLASLPAGIFDDLTGLEELKIVGSRLGSLPAGIFDGLTNLEKLNLVGNGLHNLPIGIFRGLTGLEELNLAANSLFSLQSGIFDGLTDLERLYLNGNYSTSLPTDIFDGLTKLEELRLGYNRLSSLPDLTGLTRLRNLNLHENYMGSLPSDPFDGLTELEVLVISNNELTSLSADIFDGLTGLEHLNIGINRLTSLPTDIFDGLSELEELNISHNQLTSLPDVSGLNGLRILDVSSNQLTSLPDLTAATYLRRVHLGENPLSNLSALSLADGSNNPITVTPSFDGGTVSYMATTSTDSVRVKPTATDTGRFHADAIRRDSDLANPTIEAGHRSGTFSAVTTGSASNAISLVTGDNNLEIRVSGRATETGERDAGPKTYTITVTRTSSDLIPPRLSSATVHGDVLTLTYDKSLDVNSVPAASDFSVSMAGTTVSLLATDPVTVSGFTVTLRLAKVVPVGRMATVSYTVPTGTGANPIQDIVGTEVADLSNQTVINTLTNVCHRTAQIRDAILNRIYGVTDCADVTVAQLAAIDSLDVYNKDLATLQAIDFQGFTGLKRLTMRGNGLTSLPTGIFDGLTGLAYLTIGDNRLTSLSADVFDGLTGLTNLQIFNNRLTTLPTGVFDGLTGLTGLALNSNQLTSLPAGVFDGLTGLRYLNISHNQLTSLPTGVFNDLAGLRDLYIGHNQLTSLPDLDALTGLRILSVYSNRLTSLPDLSFNAFRNFHIRMDRNPLSNLSSLALTDSSDNPVTISPSFDGGTVSYTATTSAANVRVTSTAADTGRFHANVVRYGPHRADPTIEAGRQGGALSAVTTGSAGSAVSLVTGENILEVRVTGRATESGGRDTGPKTYTITVTRTSSDLTPPRFSSAAVRGDTLTLTYDKTLDTNSVPAASDFSVSVAGIPASLAATDPVAVSGFTVTLRLATAVTFGETVTVSYTVPAGTGANPIQDMVGTEAVSLSGETVTNPLTNVCHRTAQIRDAILREIYETNDCMDVTPEHLAAIEILDANRKGIAALQAIDFQGLTGLRKLYAYSNQLTSLPAGLFDGLTGLEELYLGGNRLTSLSADVFGGLTALERLSVGGNRLTSLPTGVFDGLSQLEFLSISSNRLTSLSTGIFDDLTRLSILQIEDNQLTSASLPTGVFSSLTQLRELDLDDNQLTSLPDLTGLSDYLSLDVSNNQLTSLPDLTAFSSLFFGVHLHGNPLSNLSTLTLSDDSDNPITITPTFDGGTVSYAATTSAANVKVVPTAADTGRFHGNVVSFWSHLADPTIEAGRRGGAFAAVTSGSASDAISLVTGKNVLEVRVNGRATEIGGRDTGPRTYLISVTRTGSDTTSPTLSTATVNGDRLTLTYDEELDMDSVPLASDFSVSVDGTAVSLAATSPVAIGGSTVMLTLATAVTADQTVTVTYAVPAFAPIQDASGNSAAAITTSPTVTNETPPVIQGDVTVNVVSAGNVSTRAENAGSWPFTVNVVGADIIDSTDDFNIGLTIEGVAGSGTVEASAADFVQASQSITMTHNTARSMSVDFSIQNDDLAEMTEGFAIRPVWGGPGEQPDWLTLGGPTSTLFITDSDPLPLTVTPDVTSLAAGGTVTYTVAPSQTVLLDGFTVDWTATGATPASGTLNFANGESISDTETFSLTAASGVTAITPALTSTNSRITFTNPIPSVAVNSAPTALALPDPTDLTFDQGTDIPANTTLPEATGGIPPYTYTVSGLPDGLSFSTGSRVLSGTLIAAGTTNITYTVSDGAIPTANTESQTFSITVTSVPLTLPDPADIRTSLGAVLPANTILPAAIGGTSPYTYSISALPDGLSFDAATRMLSGTLTTDGTTTVTYTVTDSALTSATVTQDFDIVVGDNVPPRVTRPIPNQTVTAEAWFSFQFPEDTFGDPDVGSLDYTAKLSDDSPLPSWLTFNPNSRTFTGVPVSAGTITIRVTATDSHGASVHSDFDIVAATPVMLSIAGGGRVAEDGGITLTVTPSAQPDAQFTVEWAIVGGFGANAITQAALNPHHADVGSEGDWPDLKSHTTSSEGGGSGLGKGGRLTFPAGSATAQRIRLEPYDDKVYEGDETFIVIIIADGTTPVWVTLPSSIPTITITDNDTPGLTVTPTGLTVTEAPGADRTATYTVKLNTRPTADVTVTPTSSATDIATVSPVSRTFTADNWETPQQFTVTAVDDNVVNSGGRMAQISHAVSGGGNAYTGVTVASVTVSVADRDAANSAPTVANAIPDQTAAEQEVFSYTFPQDTFGDADGDILTYAVSDGPIWLSMSGRTLSGTPTNEGAVTVTVQASDDAGGTVSTTFTINVEARVSDIPVLQLATVNGDTLLLTYDEELDTNSVPAAGDFSISVDEAAASLSATTPVAIAGSTVTLTLATPVTYWQTVNLTYTVPSSNPIQDTTGTNAEDLINWVVANETLVINRASGLTDIAPEEPNLTGRIIEEETDSLEELQQTVSHIAATVATNTVANAEISIGARYDALPSTSLTLGGETLGGQQSSFDHSDVHATCSDTEVILGLRQAEPHGSGRDCVPAYSGRGLTSDELFGSSAFSVILGASDSSTSQSARWSMWGRGETSTFRGEPEYASYDGDVSNFWIGADARRDRWVAGLAVSTGTGKVDYSVRDSDDSGSLETEHTTLWPYGGWTTDNDLILQGMLGIGTGKLRRLEDGEDPVSEDLSLRAGALGMRWQAPPMGNLTMTFRLDANMAQLNTDGNEAEALEGLTADTWRLRGGVDASWSHAVRGTASLEPFAELAVRRDGGDGVSGTGLEAAGGLRYTSDRLQTELRGRWLAMHTEDGVEEFGASATLQLNPKPDGRGLSLSLNPHWGADTGSADSLWQEGLPDVHEAEERVSLDARLGYGLWLDRSGLLTPFAETRGNLIRFGFRFKAGILPLDAELASEGNGYSASANLRLRF